MGKIRPLPITAWSSLSALGDGIDQVASALREGRTGLAPGPEWLPFRTMCGAIAGDLIPLPKDLEKYECRQGRLALQTLAGIRPQLDEAMERWGSSRVAIILGTSTGGIDRTEQALEAHRTTGALPTDYSMPFQHNFYAFCDLIKKVTGVRGPSYIVSTACSSSAKVFASAARMINAGLVDAVLVGGIDTLCKTTLFGFNSLGILADELCRPFGKDRKGINLGEAGSLLLVERDGDAKAMLLGVGESSDAHHMTSPHPQGEGAFLSMKRALDSAGVSPADVDYVNAHGTGTKHNDASEAKAVERLFGDHRVPLVSTKGFTGHTLGAAGGMEAIISCVALRDQFIPPSLGADPLSEEITANVNQATRELEVKVVLSNSFGFGGNNSSVLFGVAP